MEGRKRNPEAMRKSSGGPGDIGTMESSGDHVSRRREWALPSLILLEQAYLWDKALQAAEKGWVEDRAAR